MNNKSRSTPLSVGELYNQLFSPILSKDEGIDAEQLTKMVMATLGQVSRYRTFPGIYWALKRMTTDLHRHDSRLEQNLFGCHFQNPVGLAAGFDKNGVAAGIWDLFGFGFAELGTVTWHSQKGNPRPRLFRLAAEKAALNRMGFNNNGAETVRRTLEYQRLKQPGRRDLAIGLNLGKSKATPLAEAAQDYLQSLQTLSSQADYVVINVSSPNTPGLRDLQNVNQLAPLIQQLKSFPNCPPLLVKIAPDLDNDTIDSIGHLAKEEKLAGIIAINTSLNRFDLGNRVLIQTGRLLKEEKGGLSGAPLQKRGVEVIKRLHKVVGNDLTLIGVGGIDSSKAAWERISAGASLIQLYTGWIFEGPNLVPEILDGLIYQLDRHGFRNISQVIGSHAPWYDS